jgi:hypothetical protein
LYSPTVIELVIDTIVERNESKWVKLIIAVIIGVLLTYVAHLGLFETSVNIPKSGCIGG